MARTFLTVKKKPMHKIKIFLFLIILTAIIMGSYKLNYYPQLSQGDHGRDLYSAQAILRGELPYKDFWWVYGPLMPYYFAFFYKIAGSSIVGFLLGDLVLKAAAGAFFYLACAQIVPAFVAFLGAVWFLQSQPDFFFTFNHSAGITTGLAILFLLFAYIRHKSSPYLWLTLPAILIFCLVKINFGLAAFVIVLLTAVIFPIKNRKFYLSLLAVIGLVTLSYAFLLKDLTFEEMRQCMPYFGDDQPHHFPPSMTIPYYFTQHWLTLVHSWLDLGRLASQNPFSSGIGIFMLGYSALNFLHHILVHVATLLTIWFVARGKILGQEQRLLFLFLSILGIFFIVNFHEFVVSGVWYRTYWSLPYLFAFHAIVLWFGFSRFPKLWRGIIWTSFSFLFVFNLGVNFLTLQQRKTPDTFLNSKNAKIFIGNEPQWTQTVNTVSTFLNENLKPGETFFALPYDDIYYYLTNRPSPTRMLIFFDHIKISQQQEMQIIQELESKNVAYVLLSNRMASPETGLGVFGKTYCPIIASYINAKYAPFTRHGGDWEKEPGWGHNHGVIILKKK